MDKEENLPLTIVIGDVNGLKLVNDSFGHTIGDMLLVKSANTIMQNNRPGDIAARIGGEEFAILMPNTSEEEATEIIKNIKDTSKEDKNGNTLLSISY